MQLFFNVTLRVQSYAAREVGDNQTAAGGAAIHFLTGFKRWQIRCDEQCFLFGLNHCKRCEMYFY